MGFMIEAMNAIIDWGWEHMSLNRVEALRYIPTTRHRKSFSLDLDSNERATSGKPPAGTASTTTSS